MTDPADPFPHDFAPPVAPLPYAAPPSSQRPLAVSEIISWVVIVITVAFIVGVPFFTRGRVAAAVQFESQSAPTLTILLPARSIVGLNAVYSLKAAGMDSAELKSLDMAAKTPSDQFRAAIVRAEIQGPGAAGKDLEQLGANHPDLLPDIQTLRQMYAGELPVDSDAWRSFESRHGWFADLAASEGKPPSDALRHTTINAAIRTFVVSFAGVAIAFVFGLVGFVLLIVAVVFFFQKRIRITFNRVRILPADRRAYVQAFAFYIGLYAFVSLTLRLILVRLNVSGSPLLSYAPLLLAFGVGLVWPLFRGQSWGDWRTALGLHAGKGVFREIAFGALGYITGLPLLAAGVLVTLFLTKISGLDVSHPINREFNDQPATLAYIFLLASVWAPITEELMFRGALFAHLRQRFGFWFSAIAVSLIFAGIHPQGWPAIPALGSLAFVLASLREYRGSIIASMTAHCIHNTATLAVLAFAIS